MKVTKNKTARTICKNAKAKGFSVAYRIVEDKGVQLYARLNSKKAVLISCYKNGRIKVFCYVDKKQIEVRSYKNVEAFYEDFVILK